MLLTQVNRCQVAAPKGSNKVGPYYLIMARPHPDWRVLQELPGMFRLDQVALSLNIRAGIYLIWWNLVVDDPPAAMSHLV